MRDVGERNFLLQVGSLLDRLQDSPLDKRVFEEYLSGIDGFCGDIDVQYEILRAFGFPIIEQQNKVFLSTQRLSLQDATLCFVDIETTGAIKKDGELIEIGAIKYHNGKIIDSFESYVYAPFVPEDITQLTGITQEDLSNAPSCLCVLTKFRVFLQDCIFVAHNVDFDYAFLDNAFSKHKIPGLLCPKICTIDLARRTIPAPRYKLSFLNEFLGINTPISHRAYADALTALEIYKIASLHFPDSLISVQDLIDFSKGCSHHT